MYYHITYVSAHLYVEKYVYSIQREKKRAMLIAEMDLELQAKINQDPLCMITPANPLSTLYVCYPKFNCLCDYLNAMVICFSHNEVSMSTKGRKIRKGEHLV